MMRKSKGFRDGFVRIPFSGALPFDRWFSSKAKCYLHRMVLVQEARVGAAAIGTTKAKINLLCNCGEGCGREIGEFASKKAVKHGARRAMKNVREQREHEGSSCTS